MCTYKKIGGVVDNKLTRFRTFLANNPTPDGHIPTNAMILVDQAGLLDDLTQHEKNLVEQIARLDHNNTTYRDALARMAHSGTFLKALEDIYNVQAAARSRSRSRGRSRSRSRGRSKGRSKSRNRGRSRGRSRGRNAGNA
jgi:hypothetical protein